MDSIPQNIIQVEPAGTPLTGDYDPPGDSGITHLALTLGAMALGPVHILGAVENAETVCTRRVLAHLGVTFTTDEEGWLVVTRQDRKLVKPDVELDCGKSLPTLYLMLGLLAGQPFSSMLTGDRELLIHDIRVLAEPLEQMGAKLELLGDGGHPPVRIKGNPLHPLEYSLFEDNPLLRSTLMIAGMAAVGVNKMSLPTHTRDHVDRLLKHVGVGLRRQENKLLFKGEQHIHPRRIKVPGDISAAAPCFIAATLIPKSEITVHHVGTNPGRAGFLKILQRSGGNVKRLRDWQYGTEPVSSFRVMHSPRITSFNIAPNLAPSLLDEVPLLALLATQAQGTSHIRGVGAINRIGADRIELTAQILKAFGASVEVEGDGFTIEGPVKLRGAEVSCAEDPVMAMLAITAALISEGPSTILQAEIIEQTYPRMLADFDGLMIKDN